MSDLPIRPYERAPSAVPPVGPADAPTSPASSRRLIASARPGTQSSSTSAAPRCRGCPARTSSTSASRRIRTRSRRSPTRSCRSGFGRQGGLAPFPPDPADADRERRPRRREPYRIHCHVMPPARGELRELIAFRDALRADPALRDAYAAAKRQIVEAAPDGAANQLYTARKADFVQDALYRLGDPPRTGGRAGAARRPARRSGSWAAASSAGCSRVAARAMGYRIVVLDPDPACPAAAVADEVIVGRYDDVDAARRLGRAQRRRDLRAGARGPRCRRGRRGARAAPARAGRAPGDPGPARRAPVHPRRSASTPRRGARCAGPTTPRPPPTRSATRAGSSCRSAATTAGARRGSASAARSRPRCAALGGDDGRPLLLERRSTSRPSCRWSARRDRDGPDARLPVVAQRPRRRDPRRERRPGADRPPRRPRRRRDRRAARPRPRPRRRADRRAVPAAAAAG